MSGPLILLCAVVFVAFVVAAILASGKPKCEHRATFSGRISGEWGQPRPHPHARLANAEKIRVCMMPIAQVTVCADCGEVTECHVGHDMRPAPEKPAPGLNSGSKIETATD